MGSKVLIIEQCRQMAHQVSWVQLQILIHELLDLVVD